MTASLIEVHNWQSGPSPDGGPWVLYFVAEDFVQYGTYLGQYASQTLYRWYLDGVIVPVYGGSYLLNGSTGTYGATKIRWSAVGLVTSGTHTIQLGECACHGPAFPGGPYNMGQMIVDSEVRTNTITVDVSLPDAPTSPTPADVAENVIWNDTLLWTGDPRIDGPFYYGGAFPQVPKAEYYIDSLHTVYFHKTLGSLTGVRHAYSWADDEYELREANPQYFNLSDYLFTSPYPPDVITLYWQLKTTNEWGTTWGPVWSFTTAPEGYIPPAVPPDDLITYPPTRPDAYDPDLIWQPGEWTDPTTYVPGDWGAGYVATGGGRWGQNLVVAGDNSIYYEPHEGV